MQSELNKPKKLSSKDPYIKEYLIREFKDKGRSCEDIALEYNKPKHTIHNLLHKLGIHRDEKEREIVKIDIDDLFDKYVNKKLTIRQIAKLYNLSYSTIQYKLRKNGIVRRKPVDLTGQVFGKLYVIGVSAKKSNKKLWECRCSCDQEVIVHIDTFRLKSGHTTSCGCINRIIGPGHPSWRGCGEISRSFWNATKASARVRDLEFDITIEYAWDLFLKQDRRCALSGVILEFTPLEKSTVRNTASLDRIDSSKNYTNDNIQWVHKKLNRMKVDMLDEEFVNWCHIISDYQRSKTDEIRKPT